MIKNIFLVTMAVFLVVLVVAAISNQVPATPTVIDNRCLVTVREQKYDVTEFRKGHKGGDVFKCGTDMTAIFNGQHSDKQLAKIQRYLVK